MQDSEKQHRDAIVRKSRSNIRAARSHSGFTVRPAPNLFFDILRQFAQVENFKTHHRFCRALRKSRVASTGSPRFLRRARRMESHRSEQRNHLLFLLLHAQFRDYLRKILHREQPARPVHGGNADGSEPRVQNISSVAGRIHPAGMNDLRARANGDVFGDDAEARTGFRETSFKIGFVGELVLEHVQIRHAESVPAGGFEENIVPLQRGEALRGAFTIESFEKLALRIVALELHVRARGNKKKNSSSEENS